MEKVHLSVLVYVDDLIVVGNDTNTIRQFKADLSDYFHMNDLGILKYFLGVEVPCSLTGFFLYQRKYGYYY